MEFRLYFTCPARFSELLLEDLNYSAIFLQNLIGKALNGSHLKVIVAVELDFFLSENMYTAHIHIRYDALLEAIPYEFETFKLEIESIVGQTMLQYFWEIH